MSLRSPLGEVLGLGAAKEGASHWWAQRVSSIGLLLLAPWFLISFLCLGDVGYDAVFMWVAMPLHAVLLCLLLVTLAYHAQLGLQVVVEDYVANKAVKILTMLVIDFALVVLGVLGAFFVLRIAFTSVTG